MVSAIAACVSTATSGAHRKLEMIVPGQEREFLRALLHAAVAAALPARVVPAHLPQPPKGRTIVLGAGKASAAMAKAVEDSGTGTARSPVSSSRATATAFPASAIEIVEAAHPVPDERGRDAARRILGAGGERRAGRSRALPHLRRRLGAAGASRRPA